MKWVLEEKMIEKARESGRQHTQQVKYVGYDAKSEKIRLVLNNESDFSIPVRLIQGLEDATPEQLSKVEVNPLGDGLSWEALDVDVSIEGLKNSVFGTAAYMTELAKRGGQAVSEIKAQAARNNGKLGGRPISKSKVFWDRLKTVGLSKSFVLQRILPYELAHQVETAKSSQTKDRLLEVVSEYIKKVYTWDLDQILGSENLHHPNFAAASARFKMPGNVNEEKASAYIIYAHYIALLALQATSHLPKRPLEEKTKDVVDVLCGSYGGVTLDSVLNYLWDYGVVTFSLNDSGSFHGACWRVDGRNVIVLKQKTESEYRALFDLLHERDHISQDQEKENFQHLEMSETSEERRTSKEEQMASFNAGNISLLGRAEELAELCVNEAKNSVERLKSAVQMIAIQENVNVSALANYLAFRLSINKQNWWGAANNLQTKGDPRRVINDKFLQHADLDLLNSIDRDMLLRSISE